MTKTITKRLTKLCVICGKVAHVKVYSDRSYRGGHFFGADYRVLKGKRIKAEYWECSKCYWRG